MRQVFWVFGLLWQIISLLFHAWLVQVPPNMHAHRFAKMDSSAKAKGSIPHLLWGDALSLFDPRGAFLFMCSRGGFLDLRNDGCGPLTSLLQQSSAPAINFVFGVSGKTKLQSTPLDTLRLLCPGAHLPPTSLILASPSDSSLFDFKIFIIGKIKNLHLTVFLKLAIALCVPTFQTSSITSKFLGCLSLFPFQSFPYCSLKLCFAPSKKLISLKFFLKGLIIEKSNSFTSVNFYQDFLLTLTLLTVSSCTLFSNIH